MIPVTRVGAGYLRVLPDLGDPHCTRCELHAGAQRVCLSGDGPKSPILVVGEAPGFTEDRDGIPFIGQSGRLLNEQLAQVDIFRTDIRVTNSVRCRPPGNRKPKASEVKACKPFLHQEMDYFDSKYVLLLGNVALQSITGKTGIKAARGHAFEKDGRIYFPTYHPSYILRDNRNLPEFQADLREFAKLTRTGQISTRTAEGVKIIDNLALWLEMFKDLEGLVVLDIETSCLYPWDKDAKVISLGISTRRNKWVWPFGHPSSRGVPWGKDTTKGLMRKLSAQLEECSLVGQFAKFDSLWLKVHYGIDVRFDRDIGLMHWQTDENHNHDLEWLAQVILKEPAYDVPQGVKNGTEGTLEQHANYLALDLEYPRRLLPILRRTLDQDPGSHRVYEKITQPLSRVYRDIEFRGVYIDVPRMQEVEHELNLKVRACNARLKKYADINWNSNDQIAEVLFNKLKQDPIVYTPTGKPSVKEEVLLQIDHPCVDDVLKLRRAKKLLGTYINGWKPFLVDSRIHPSYKIHGTVTSRPSCEHPNVQQTDRDELIRSLITAPDGWQLVEWDLSQAELREAAELSGDPTMRQVFQEGKDIHWMSALDGIRRARAYEDLVMRTAKAAVVYKVKDYEQAIQILLDIGPDAAIKIDKEWKDLRYKAKAKNFGFVYGMYPKKYQAYARNEYGIHLTMRQAYNERKHFFALYSGLIKWHEKSKSFARRNGYVRYLSGAKRRLPNAQLEMDCPERAEAERQAINSPVQGWVAHLLLMALIEGVAKLDPERFQPVGTVHDSILAEVRNDYIEECVPAMIEIMEHPELLDEWRIKLQIPLEAEAKIGPWSKGVSLEEWRS